MTRRSGNPGAFSFSEDEMTEPSTTWKLTLAWVLRRPDLVAVLRVREPSPADFDALRDQLYRDGYSFDEAEKALRDMFFPVLPPSIGTEPANVGTYRKTVHTSRNIGSPPRSAVSPHLSKAR